MLDGRLIGELTGTGTAATQFFLTDTLGSVLATLNATAGSAALQGNQVYGPYGNSLYKQGSIGTSKGFTGQYSDVTGLDYYNARYYDPIAGLFISADTVQGNLQGFNPYAYVSGNPETTGDPTGHWGIAIAGAVILGVATLATYEAAAGIFSAPLAVPAGAAAIGGFIGFGVGVYTQWDSLSNWDNLSPLQQSNVADNIGISTIGGALSGLELTIPGCIGSVLGGLGCFGLTTAGLAVADHWARQAEQNHFHYSNTPPHHGNTGGLPIIQHPSSSSAASSQRLTASAPTSPKHTTSSGGGYGMSYYTVASGDSLWAIAARYYGSGSLWQSIYQQNTGVIGSNPNLIYPGERLAIRH